MDLILWRHAEAIELPENLADNAAVDLTRTLTARGEKQALRMGAWLDRQLPETAKILVSPAVRAQATARAMGRKFQTLAELSPSATAVELLVLSQWPQAKQAVVLIGHQPGLGRFIAQLLALQTEDCAIKKGAVWWLRSRTRDALQQTVLVTVQSPEFL